MARGKGARATETEAKDTAPANTGPLAADPHPVEPDRPEEAAPEPADEADEDLSGFLPWLEALDEDQDARAKRPTPTSAAIIAVALVILLAGIAIYWQLRGSIAPNASDVPMLADTSETPGDTPEPSEEGAEPRKAPETTPAQSAAAKPGLPSGAAPQSARLPATAPTRVVADIAFAPPRQGQLIQLASYYTREQAEAYWATVSRRHDWLAGLRHQIVEGSFNGKTVYRLRLSGTDANARCQRLKASGDACLQIGH